MSYHEILNWFDEQGVQAAFSQVGDKYEFWDANKLANGVLASFSIAAFPGSKQIAVSHGAWVREDWRGKGLNTLLVKLRQDIARDRGFYMMLATALMHGPSRTCMEKHDWIMVEPNACNYALFSCVLSGI